MTIKELIALTALAAVLGVLACTRSQATECYSSLHDARKSHPTEHISWSHGCFYLGRPGRPPREARERHDRRPVVRPARVEVSHVPVPKERAHGLPADALAYAPVPQPDPVEPHKVHAFTVRHIPELDSPNPEPLDAGTMQRPAYDPVALRRELSAKAEQMRLRMLIEEQAAEIARLRDVLTIINANQEGKR